MPHLTPEDTRLLAWFLAMMVCLLLFFLVVVLASLRRTLVSAQNRDELVDYAVTILTTASNDVERASRAGKDTARANALIARAIVRLLEAQVHRRDHSGLVARAAVQQLDDLCRQAIKLAGVDDRILPPMPEFDAAGKRVSE